MSCCNDVIVIPSETVVTVDTGGGSGGTTTSFVRIPGSSFAGGSGGFGRSYTYTKAPLTDSVSISGRVLDSTSQYAINTNTITINDYLDDTDYVVFAVNS